MKKFSIAFLIKESLFIGIAFGIVIWGIIGEMLFGIYGWPIFLLLLIIPMFVLFRWTNLDLESFPYHASGSKFSFERTFSFIIILVTLLCIPYLFVISGIMPQDTFLSNIFRGTFGHKGVHHGWVGWVLMVEGYLYYRLNRHARKYYELGLTFQNVFFILGLFLFLHDYWYEEIGYWLTKINDPFQTINTLLPFSWQWNLFLEIVIIIILIIIGHLLYFAKSHSSK
jgi:hypothetical protein